ncbi:cytochrome b/b6 domain-containing protein [Psychromarinibacter sp. C21-152]|uniref:Cytochrome b/b6 domain-containing protein n=1 Tax=Psychromarinibacter sediminicola TaxID=3033385 RepID=A0AAE3TAE8_9RHOB|nr:cytochrome b/b6 domain-containing protein [Psychromarinibacter sediminicola]MDF0603187.1 cytochrome b/b6 domain-containing protein [Psychromarinibacter sediminicola]
MSRPATYSRLQIGLHWAIALLIAGAWFTHEQMEREPGRSEPDGLMIGPMPLHVALGLAVFALLLVRIVHRAMRGVPEPVAGTPPLARRAAEWGHRLLYALMLAAPLAGMARAFGGIEPAGELHEMLATALVLVALAHAAVAVFHQAVLRDGTLSRMTRGRA